MDNLSHIWYPPKWDQTEETKRRNVLTFSSKKKKNNQQQTQFSRGKEKINLNPRDPNKSKLNA